MEKKYKEFTVEILEQLKELGYKYVSATQQLSRKDVGFHESSEFSHFLIVPFTDLYKLTDFTLPIDDEYVTNIAKGIDLVFHWVDVQDLQPD